MSEFFEFIVELLLEILGILFDFSNASLIMTTRQTGGLH